MTDLLHTRPEYQPQAAADAAAYALANMPDVHIGTEDPDAAYDTADGNYGDVNYEFGSGYDEEPFDGTEPAQGAVDESADEPSTDHGGNEPPDDGTTPPPPGGSDEFGSTDEPDDDNGNKNAQLLDDAAIARHERLIMGDTTSGKTQALRDLIDPTVAHNVRNLVLFPMSGDDFNSGAGGLADRMGDPSENTEPLRFSASHTDNTATTEGTVDTPDPATGDVTGPFFTEMRSHGTDITGADATQANQAGEGGSTAADQPTKLPEYDLLFPDRTPSTLDKLVSQFTDDALARAYEDAKANLPKLSDLIGDDTAADRWRDLVDSGSATVIDLGPATKETLGRMAGEALDRIRAARAEGGSPVPLEISRDQQPPVGHEASGPIVPGASTRSPAPIDESAPLFHGPNAGSSTDSPANLGYQPSIGVPASPFGEPPRVTLSEIESLPRDEVIVVGPDGESGGTYDLDTGGRRDERRAPRDNLGATTAHETAAYDSGPDAEGTTPNLNYGAPHQTETPGQTTRSVDNE